MQDSTDKNGPEDGPDGGGDEALIVEVDGPPVRRLAIPVPSPATSEEPVPTPIRPKHAPVSNCPAADGSPAVSARTEASAGAPAAQPPAKRKAGFTTAIRLGPEKGAGGKLTTQLHREQERVNVREDVEVTYRFCSLADPDLGAEEYRGRLLDISLDGAQIRGPLPESISEERLLSGKVALMVVMELPFVNEVLTVDCHAGWIGTAGGGDRLIGLSYVRLSDEQIGTIRGFLIGLQSPTRKRFKRR